jgi:hypothetical protein
VPDGGNTHTLPAHDVVITLPTSPQRIARQGVSRHMPRPGYDDFGDLTEANDLS